MKIADIVGITGSRVICGQEKTGAEITYAFSSDLLSDVLTINRIGILLITGAANIQTIRTAEMAEVAFILLVRNKKANPEMISLARDSGIVIAECPSSMFGVSGKLFQAGIKPLY